MKFGYTFWISAFLCLFSINAHARLPDVVKSPEPYALTNSMEAINTWGQAQGQTTIHKIVLDQSTIERRLRRFMVDIDKNMSVIGMDVNKIYFTCRYNEVLVSIQKLDERHVGFSTQLPCNTLSSSTSNMFIELSKYFDQNTGQLYEIKLYPNRLVNILPYNSRLFESDTFFQVVSLAARYNNLYARETAPDIPYSVSANENYPSPPKTDAKTVVPVSSANKQLKKATTSAAPTRKLVEPDVAKNISGN